MLGAMAGGDGRGQDGAPPSYDYTNNGRGEMPTHLDHHEESLMDHVVGGPLHGGLQLHDNAPPFGTISSSGAHHLPDHITMTSMSMTAGDSLRPKGSAPSHGTEAPAPHLRISFERERAAPSPLPFGSAAGAGATANKPKPPSNKAAKWQSAGAVRR